MVWEQRRAAEGSITSRSDRPFTRTLFGDNPPESSLGSAGFPRKAEVAPLARRTRGDWQRILSVA